MIIYFLMFAIAFLWYYSSLSRPELAKSPLLLAAYFAYLAVFIGMGDMIGGYDRYIYGALFDSISDSVSYKQDVNQLLYFIRGKEYAYFAWEVLVAHVTSNRYVFILLGTCLMYGLYYRAFRKYMDNYPMACIVFLGLFVFFSRTYMRQTIACGIAWQAVKYIWERKPIPFFALVILAAGFHNSALVLAPMYFVPIIKYSPSIVIYFLVFCLLLGISPFASWAISLAGDATGTESRTALYTNDKMSGFQIWYVIEAVVFIGILFKNYHKIPKTPKDLTFLNMFIVFCGILVAFARFGQGGRFGWFYFIGLIYTLSALSTRIHSYKWMKTFVIFLCFVLFTRVLRSWAFNLTPYKTFLTNGYPSGVYEIYEENEYDVNYTNDKLYRKVIDIK